MDQIVKLPPQFDLSKIQSLIEWSNVQRVILVVPHGAKAFDSEHAFVLLHRWADEADVSLALVSDEYGLRETAAAAGIPVFNSPEKAQKSTWNWRRVGPGEVRRSNALDGIIGSRPKALDKLGLSGVPLLITLALFLFASGVLFVAALLLIPSGRITVHPAALDVSDSREVILDPTVTTIDQINNILPATPLRREISGTATLATTRVDTAPADNATGAVVFTNLAGAAATIPVGTVVETSSGITVRFSTTVQAELPAGYNARVSVPVRAMTSGPAGNVKPLQINTIEGPLSSVARVINTSQMSGGGIKQVHLVSFEDKQKLREQLTSQLRSAAISRIKIQAGADTVVAPASVDVSVISETFDHLVDDPADTLSLHIEAVATGMAADRTDLEKFAQGVLMDKVPKGYAVLPGTLNVIPDSNARAEGNSILFTLHSDFKVTPQVKAEDLLKGLKGKSPEEAAGIIEQRVNLAEPALIELNPSWWPRLPLLDFRLVLFVEPEIPGQPGASLTSP